MGEGKGRNTPSEDPANDLRYVFCFSFFPGAGIRVGSGPTLAHVERRRAGRQKEQALKIAQLNEWSEFIVVPSNCIRTK